MNRVVPVLTAALLCFAALPLDARRAAKPPVPVSTAVKLNSATASRSPISRESASRRQSWSSSIGSKRPVQENRGNS